MALIERAVPGMKERGFGRILNVSSSAVREPIPVLMLSNAHRSGLLAAFKTLARDLAGDGITVNTVLPGRIATDRLADPEGSLEGAEAAAKEQVPAGPPRHGRGVRRRGGVPLLRPGVLRHWHRRPRGRRPHAVDIDLGDSCSRLLQPYLKRWLRRHRRADAQTLKALLEGGTA